MASVEKINLKGPQVTKTVSGEGRTVPDPRVLVLHPTTLRGKAKARASLHPVAPPHPTKGPNCMIMMMMNFHSEATQKPMVEKKTSPNLSWTP